MRFLRIEAVLIAAVTLVACASKPPEGVRPDSQAYARSIVVEKVDAAVEAQRELAAATQEGAAQRLRKQSALETDAVDIDYIGPAQPLLEEIAFRYGYRYVETGKIRDLAPVNLRVQSAPVEEVLHNIAYQIDSNASVELDRQAKVLRLLYKKG
jgi:defect-in-organelle-trafficking protein DotD